MLCLSSSRTVLYGVHNGHLPQGLSEEMCQTDGTLVSLALELLIRMHDARASQHPDR